MAQELSNTGKWKAEGEKRGVPERIYTTGAFLQPQLIDGTWLWVVVEFESDSFYDGDYISPQTEADTWQELAREYDEDEDETSPLTINQVKQLLTLGGCEYKPFTVNGVLLHGWHSDGYPALVYPKLDGAVITRAYLQELYGLLSESAEVGGRLHILAANAAIGFTGDYHDIEHFRFVFKSLPDEAVTKVAAMAGEVM